MSPTPPEAGLAIAPPSTAAPELGFDDLRLPTTGALLAGRYRLERKIGKGGYGIVFAATDLHLRGSTATDTHLRGQVAVKLLLPRGDLDRARFRRELAALRLLDLPGVVRWLDAGEIDGQMFVVTELIDGVRFPGIERPCTWEALAPVAIALFEVLARIHKAGVVHRDLKPFNVLVDTRGRPTVLDFGLAMGREIGEAITGAGVVGTPGYLAPEQVLGHRADARSDLYAAGVMLFEALSGRRPHPERDHMAPFSAALADSAPGLASVVAGVPRTVARVVDRLLQSDPTLRYSSADAVLTELAELTPDPAPSGAVPWLGGDGTVDSVVQRLLAGRSIDLHGAAGSGRNGFVRRVAERLAAAGSTVVFTARSRQAFASLCELGPSPELAADIDIGLAALQARVSDGVRQALRRRTVVLCDDWERLDASSSQVLEACRGDGAILRVVGKAAEADVVLPPLAEADLGALFHGPDKVLHLREDAARLLHRRTRGLAGRVVREVEAWVRAGMAEWRDGKLDLRRPDLDRLQAALPLSFDRGVRLDADLAPALTARGGEAADAGATPTPGAYVNSVLAETSLNDLLAWVHVAWPGATAAVLARAMGKPLWQVEAAALELEAKGGLVRIDGLLVPRWPLRRVWSIEQLRAAHAKMAHELAPGSERRLYHFVAAGLMPEAAEEARTSALGLLADGRPNEAMALLQLALPAVRELVDGTAEAAMLDALLRVALALEQVEALDDWLYHHSRATKAATRHLRPELALARAVAASMRSRDEATLCEVLAVPPMGDIVFDAARWRQRVYVARARGAAAEAEQLAATLAWADATDQPVARALVDVCQGWSHYLQGRYQEAADCHERAAGRAVPAHTRVAALLNAASARMETGQLDESLAVALRLLDLAAERRLAAAEARAWWLVRAIHYRTGNGGGPDLELCAAVAAAGNLTTDMVVAQTEAAFAWRNGDDETARRLARYSARIAAQAQARAALVVARLIGAAAGATLNDAERADCLAFCESCPDAAMRLQVAALCAMSFALPPGLAERVREAANEAGVDLASSQRLDVLSPAEADALLATMAAVGSVTCET